MDVEKLIDGVVARFIGTKHERDIKRIQPLIAEINALEPEMQKLSDEDFGARTLELKSEVQGRIEGIERDDPNYKQKLRDAVDPASVPAFALAREAGRVPLPHRGYPGNGSDQAVLGECLADLSHLHAALDQAQGRQHPQRDVGHTLVEVAQQHRPPRRDHERRLDGGQNFRGPGLEDAEAAERDRDLARAEREAALADAAAGLLAELGTAHGLFGPWTRSWRERPVHPERVTAGGRRARDTAGIDRRWRLHDYAALVCHDVDRAGPRH